jgi:NAD(P)-dependent dehydrogenase (short-subunit alcohol dehydrogenase family)
MAGMLEGKTGIVTGAGQGIGRESARVMAAEGARLVVSDINLAMVEETAHLISMAGGTAIPLKVDVARGEDLQAIVELAVSHFGRLDCAFNNAGISGEGSLLADFTEEGYDQLMAVNLKAVWRAMKLEINQMLRQGGGGAIVNTSSVGGLVGKERLSVYCAAKHAVLGLTKSAALEYGAQGVRVNAVCPGVVRTPMVEAVISSTGTSLDDWSRLQPIGRFGTPSEIGEAVTWLCSDRASLVHGHALVADGGLTCA